MSIVAQEEPTLSTESVTKSWWCREMFFREETFYLSSRPVRLFGLTLWVLTLTACGKSDPGPLAGTWRADGFLPYTGQFRAGEGNTMSMNSQVTYEVSGRNALVTYQDGLTKGMTMRYTMLSPTIARSSFHTLRRVGP